MSIDAYVGLPGSGKTYSVVAQQVLPAIRAGRHVVTNLPLKLDLIDAEIEHKGVIDLVELQEIEAAPDRLPEVAPPGCVLILDEIWRLFPAGKKVEKIPEAYKYYFAEHRHRVDQHGNSTQIVLVTQDLAQISAFARQLIETTYRTTKLTTLGMSKRYRVDVYHGPVSGPNPPINQALRQIFGKYDPKVYRYYNSHTQSESATEGANESSIDSRANILKRPLMMLAPVIILALIGFGAYGLYHQKKALEAKPTRDGFTTLAAPPSAPTARGEAAPPEYWHLTARLAGLCWEAQCGWALMEKGPLHEWIPLRQCTNTGPNWTCRFNTAAVDGAALVPAPRAAAVTPAANRPGRPLPGAPTVRGPQPLSLRSAALTPDTRHAIPSGP